MLFLIVKTYSGAFLESKIGEVAVKRMESKSEQGDSRPKIWKELLESKNILFYSLIGEGNSLFVNGKIYSPHSGHFVFIFAYGLICYYLYMYLVFRKMKKQTWSDYLPILPFLVCFTVNIGIGELKFAVLMYMVIAYSRIRIYFQTKELNQNLNAQKSYYLV